MAFAAKLSKRFYDRLGEDIVNELVDLLNQVLTDSRTDLRAINEANMARVDAMVEQRIAEVRADLRILKSDLEQRIEQIDVRVERRLAEHGAALRQDMNTQTRFMYFAWAVQVAAIVGLYAR